MRHHLAVRLPERGERRRGSPGRDGSASRSVPPLRDRVPCPAPFRRQARLTTDAPRPTSREGRATYLTAQTSRPRIDRAKVALRAWRRCEPPPCGEDNRSERRRRDCNEAGRNVPQLFSSMSCIAQTRAARPRCRALFPRTHQVCGRVAKSQTAQAGRGHRGPLADVGGWRDTGEKPGTQSRYTMTTARASAPPWLTVLASVRYLVVPSCFCVLPCPSMAIFTFLGCMDAGSGMESSSTPF